MKETGPKGLDPYLSRRRLCHYGGPVPVVTIELPMIRVQIVKEYEMGPGIRFLQSVL